MAIVVGISVTYTYIFIPSWFQWFIVNGKHSEDSSGDADVSAGI